MSGEFGPTPEELSKHGTWEQQNAVENKNERKRESAESLPQTEREAKLALLKDRFDLLAKNMSNKSPVEKHRTVSANQGKYETGQPEWDANETSGFRNNLTEMLRILDSIDAVEKSK